MAAARIFTRMGSLAEKKVTDTVVPIPRIGAEFFVFRPLQDRFGYVCRTLGFKMSVPMKSQVAPRFFNYRECFGGVPSGQASFHTSTSTG